MVEDRGLEPNFSNIQSVVCYHYTNPQNKQVQRNYIGALLSEQEI